MTLWTAAKMQTGCGGTVADSKRRTRRAFGKIQAMRSGRYQASYTGPDGARHTGPHTFEHREDAEGWLAEVHRAIRNGTWSRVSETPDDTPAPVLGEYAVQWLDHREVRGRPLKPRTVAHYERLLERFILPRFADHRLDEITPSAVRDWWNGLRDTTGRTYRSHAYSLLRAILSTAVGDQLIAANPCVIKGAGTAARASETKVPTLAELDAIVDSMPDRLRAMVLISAWCSLRYGEAAELRRRDLELDMDGPRPTGVVHVRRAVARVGGEHVVGKPKSDAGVRDVTIPFHIVPVLASHLATHVEPEGDALLFPASSGGHLANSAMKWHFNKARAAAGRPDLRFHDLRHTGLTLAAHEGATLAELMARAGHSTAAAAMRYQHSTDSREQLIAERLAVTATRGSGSQAS
ncbi:site-specific integrase [Isoptericola sp. AK164]|uniref:tyrosine-type recombinase/integrase n=1 Tax=Isoptericola sp. AK164 TaxID=3024246 RepID=UPI0024184B2D|nr:site-specific integrase [Isoptericola sp. AK164]